MITYDYECKKCQTIVEIRKSIKDKSDEHCQECNEIMSKVMSGGMVSYCIGSDTLGNLAEKNTKKLGRYGVEEKDRPIIEAEKAKTEKRKSWYNPKGEDLLKKHKKRLSNEKAVEKYIMEGE